MFKIRTFPIDKYEEFNEFRQKFSPRGDNGIRFTTNHIIMTYEEGEPMVKSDKIQSLKFDLGRHLEQQLQYYKQIRRGKKMRDSFIKNSQQWNDTNAQYAASIGMLKIEVLDTEVVVEILKELGEDVKVENFAIPELEEDAGLVQSNNPTPSGTITGKGGKKRK